jgi:hypothetical protein
MASFSFSHNVLSKGINHKNVATAQEVKTSQSVPQALEEPVRSPDLEEWFQQEAKKRLATLPQGCLGKQRQDLLEKPNRYADGSMAPISLNELLQMTDLCGSADDILNRAQQGVELLRTNDSYPEYGTAARGVPGGGASSRAAKWTRLHPELAKRFGLTETLPRPLFRVGSKTLLQHTLDMSQSIARNLGKVFPNVIMTNSENVSLFLDVIRKEWGNYTPSELDATVLFNQIVLPRMWVDDETLIQNKLYPAGHGDYPYLFGKYHFAKALQECGIHYLVFSNADEWLWQADPVMISIARELFDQGHHMVIIGTKNTNNQFGGGFVRQKDGTQSLVETPRLPWDVVEKGTAPVALNTTFYMIDVDYLAAHERALIDVEKSLVVKEVPGRQDGAVEQILGVDSWAGDVFAACLNPAFIEWPRLNFLGIKDGGFISGEEPKEELGGRTYLHYVNETVNAYPVIMKRLIEGDKNMASFLADSGYSYF